MTIQSETLGKETPQRILFIDIMRGLAIFGVLFIHPLIYGIWQTETIALNLIPTWLLALGSPLIIAASWGGGFPLLSAFVSTYITYKRLGKYSFKQSTFPIILNSSLLIILDPLKAALVTRTWTNAYSSGYNYSVLTHILKNNKLALPSAEKIFQIGSLPAIGLSGYLTVMVLYFLFQKNGINQVKSNIGILTTLGIIFSVISNPINHLLHTEVKQLYIAGGFSRLLAYFLRFFIGAQLSFFPMGTYAFFGMLGGYLLAIRADITSIKIISYSLGTFYLLAFASTTIITLITASSIESGLFSILDYEIYPNELLFLSLGLMFLLFVPLITMFEYIDHEKKMQLAKSSWVMFFRRFGIVSLTFYITEPLFNGIIAHIFHSIFGDTSQFGIVDPFMTNVPAIILFLLVILAFWSSFAYLWAKIAFKYGIEYWIKKITQNLRQTPSLRLKVETYE